MDLDLRGEIQIGGVWVDATGNLLTRQAITHSRGRQDLASRVDPSACRPLINNTDGQFSWDNPLSPHYGKFGRNAPFRLSLRAGSPFLDLPGHSFASAEVLDTAVLDIAGDIDIRLDAQLSNWTTYSPGSIDTLHLIGKLGGSAGTKSWFLGTRGGALFFEWSADGTASLSATSTVPLPLTPSDRMALRVTLDVNNGSGGRTVTFYTAPSGTSGPWTQLGAPIVQAGTTSIYNSAISLRIGRATDVGFTQPQGRVFRAEVRNGINGTIVAAPDFTAQAVGAGSFVDSSGLTWSLFAPATIDNRRTRLSHEIAAVPVEGHPSGQHAWITAQTAGILRRMRRNSKALESTLRRRVPSYGPLAYWPMEDGQSATSASSPIAGVRPLTLTNVAWSSADSLPSSRALPVLSGTPEPSGMVGKLPRKIDPLSAWHVQWVYRLDSIPAVRRTFMRILTDGTVNEWLIQSGADGTTILGRTSEGATLVNDNIGTGSDLFGQWVRVQFRATQNGGLVDYEIVWTDVGGDSGGFFGSTLGGVGTPTAVASPTGGFSSDLNGMAIGHISVWGSAFTAAYDRAIDAWTGETAGERMRRLVTEEDVPLTVAGVIAAQTLVGPQLPARVLELLEEAADADGGILYEDRESPALRYRDRASMYSQPAALVLDFTAPGLAPPLRGTGDDDATENDIEVQRVNGSSGRAVLETGPLSIQEPPAGVGPYPALVPLNLHTDEQTEPIAYWRLHHGTYEGRRFPQVHVMLHAAPELADQVLAVDVGDKIVIRNAPKWLAPGDIELIVQGYDETFASERQWDIVFNCTPGAPWEVGIRDDAVLARRETSGCVLAEDLTTTETDVDLLTTAGLVWTADHVDMPFDLQAGGEVVTVTGPGGLAVSNPFFETSITGWTGQSSTVTRSTAVVQPQGVASMQITPDGVAASGGASGTMTAAGTVQPGATYTASLWAYSPGGSSDLRPAVDWYTAGGALISSSLGSAFVVAAGQWTFLTQSFQAPATASRAVMRARHGGTPPASAIWYVWAPQVTLPKASWLLDTVNRAVSSGWGTADTGQAWARVGGGPATDYNVVAGIASQILSTVDISRRTSVTAVHPDADIYCDITTSALATGTDGLYGAVTARMVDASNMYMARVQFSQTNTVTLSVRKIVADVQTQLGAVTLPITHVAGQWVRVRFQLVGSTLRAKAWLSGSAEPSPWLIEVTDTVFTAAAQIGTRSIRATGNTNAATVEVRYRAFDVVNPQTFTVRRSVNGVVKALTAGTAVSLAQPTPRAL